LRNEDGIKKLKNNKKLKDLKWLVGGQLAAGATRGGPGASA